MRGKRQLLRNRGFGVRITPAGAGKTGTVGVSAVGIEDHPRRCGENRKALISAAVIPGSPPQVRGKLHTVQQVARVIGITPAGAGKTTGYRRCGVQAPDHPRRCGENQLGQSLAGCVLGSPPQVRGKLFLDFRLDLDAGITPAGAGKTLPSCWHSGKV